MTLIKSISGIRGTIGGNAGKSLTPIDVVKFSTAFGHWVNSRHNYKTPKIVLGRDARISGSYIASIIANSLNMQGIDIIDLNLSTTPTVELAVVKEKAQGGIIITASHNPNGWNALKLLNEKGEFISAEVGQEIIRLSESDEVHFSESRDFGKYTTDNSYIDYHIDEVLKLDWVDVEAIKKRKFKIIVDAVNSSGALIVPKLLKKLGVEVKELYCETNGYFPHDPEPIPENLNELSQLLEKGSYDLGIAVDPDVDRLVFVCENGVHFGEEYSLVAVSDYILSKEKGNTVSNLSSTKALKIITEKYGGSYFASAVGEVNVIEKMKEVKAVIGGEGNGGIIYPKLHYGRDAIVGIALFLSHLAHFKKPISHLKSTYPNFNIIKSKITLEDIDTKFLFKEIQEKYKKNDINLTDGLKIEFDYGWVHLRTSNTEPIIRIIAETENEVMTNNLIQKFKSDIKEILSLKK